MNAMNCEDTSLFMQIYHQFNLKNVDDSWMREKERCTRQYNGQKRH